MALRIGGGKKMEAPVEEPMAEEQVPMEEEVMPEDLLSELPETLEEEPMLEEQAPAGQVDMVTAGYLGPEEGPFVCDKCGWSLVGDVIEGTPCPVCKSPIEFEEEQDA